MSPRPGLRDRSAGGRPGTVSARADRLVADGLVVRSPDPADKRGSPVTLTERGRHVPDAVVPAHLANQVRMLGSLTAEEQAAPAGLLRKLLVAFEGSAALESLPVRLGLTLAPVHVAPAMQRAVGLPERAGLLVRSEDEQSPAAAAGLAGGEPPRGRFLAAGTRVGLRRPAHTRGASWT